MALLDRETLPPRISAKGLIYSALLLLLVVSLFFIPELVKLQEKITASKKTSSSITSLAGSDTSRTSNDVNIDEILEASRSGASLDSILSMVENNKTRPSESSETLSIPAPSSDIPTNSKFSNRDLPNRSVLEQALLSPQVTWDQLTTSQVKQSLKAAQSGAVKILKDLPARQSSVRFALINYINGIGWLAKSDRKIMSAEEALAYIEQLDINVTQAMISSEIDAGDFEAWKQISIGSVTGRTGRASALKVQTRVAFNPRLTLSGVEIMRRPDYVKRGAGWKLVKDPRSRVKVSGFVLGKDARKIVVMRNGRRIGDVRIPSRLDDQGARVFKWQTNDGEGLLTFRVYTKGGQAFQKHYAFIPKVYQKFAQDKDGYFMLPFGSDMEGSVDLQSYDQRLDRFFRVGRSSIDDSNVGFDTF